MPDRDFISRAQEGLSLPLDPDSVASVQSTIAQNTNAQSADAQQDYISSLVRDVVPEGYSIADSGFSPSANALSPPLFEPLTQALQSPTPPATPSVPPKTPPAAPPVTTPVPGCACHGLCLTEPYPVARSSSPNDRYGRIIRNSYSGRESELTGMLNLLYHALRFSECAEDVKTILLEIAACKLFHLSLLGELLSSLGGDPKFFYFLSQTGNATSWWAANPTTLTYAKNLGEALKADIDAEKAAIDAHYSAINYIDDSDVTNLLKRIVRDEEYHLKILTELYQRFCS